VDAAACGILMPPIKPIYLLAPILPAGPALPAQGGEGKARARALSRRRLADSARNPWW